MTAIKRPPIVTVLGHVDHGKTSLLDYIRKTSVTKKEAGGITQSIGASKVTAKDGSTITFIDTPGHAAFSAMRSRGAKVADIAILIVAGNDGVKPQTKEALETILAAQIPYLVAATKSDLQTFSIDTVRGQLEKMGVLFEGRGGDVPLIPVSSVSGDGIEHLLEMIALLSEMHEITGDTEAPLEAVIIETTKDQRGPAASLVVRNGLLKVGDEITTESANAKVRGLFDWTGTQVKAVAPGEPAYVIGFEEVPQVGSRVWYASEHRELETIEERSLLPEEIEGKHTVIIKAKSSGSLEAILAQVPKELFVVSQGVGDITENDIFVAKAAKAKIYAFEVKSKGGVSRLADTEGVKIEEFKIVYELFERLEQLAQKGKIEVVGKAQIIASFPFEDKKIAGSRILSGNFAKPNGKFILQRNEKELGVVRILSIRKGKNEVPSVRQGDECGILFVPQLDFKIGDVILSVRTT
jgi:translation initiation factor IF-2